MDLTFRGKAPEGDERARERAEQKFQQLERIEPRAVRAEVAFAEETGPRVRTRVDAALHVPRKTFRASAEDDDPVLAVDRVVERLQRQVHDHHGKRRAAQHRRIDE